MIVKIGWWRKQHDRRAASCLIWALAAILPAWLPGALHARQDARPPQPPPGIEIKIQAQPLKATVGDPIQIDLDFAFPRDYRFSFPSLPAQIGDFSVLETYPGPDIPAGRTAGSKSAPPGSPAATAHPGIAHHRARIVAAVYRPGDFEFPALSFTLIDAQGKEIQVASPTARIRIESILALDDSKLIDLKKQAEIEEPFPWLLWLSLGALAIALLLLVWWSQRRRRRPVAGPSSRSELDPLDLAETELKDLLGRGLIEKGFIKQFYVRISDIIRKALEAGYGIQTIEMTTTEIIALLEQSSGTGAENIRSASLESIESFLLSCDLVKFARYLPARPEIEGVVTQAFLILANCRNRRLPTPTGAATGAGGA